MRRPALDAPRSPPSREIKACHLGSPLPAPLDADELRGASPSSETTFRRELRACGAKTAAFRSRTRNAPIDERCNAPPRAARAAAPGPLRVSAYFWEEEVESWDSLLQKAGIDVLQGFSVARRTTVPQSSSCDWIAAVENPQGLTDKPVVLYRDANSQCPYCERVRCVCKRWA